MGGEIAATVLALYERCWNEHRITALETLWDVDEPNPIYIAEEVADTLIGWDAIRAYWLAAETMIPRLAIRTFDQEERPVAPGITLLHFGMHWNAELANGSEYGGDVRATALLREKGGRHLFFHYIEAPLGALPFLQRAYSAAVDPAFRRPRP
jgi:hypothetical protein